MEARSPTKVRIQGSLVCFAFLAPSIYHDLSHYAFPLLSYLLHNLEAHHEWILLPQRINLLIEPSLALAAQFEIKVPHHSRNDKPHLYDCQVATETWATQISMCIGLLFQIVDLQSRGPVEKI